MKVVLVRRITLISYAALRAAGYIINFDISPPRAKYTVYKYVKPFSTADLEYFRKTGKR